MPVARRRFGNGAERHAEAVQSAKALRRVLGAAADSVVALVAAAKGLSHIDRALVATELDVRYGLADTLTVMAHALRDRRMTLRE